MTSLPKKSERGPTNIPSANPVECLVSLVHQHFRFEDVLAEIENPQWTRLGSAWGDWKQYIDEELRHCGRSLVRRLVLPAIGWPSGRLSLNIASPEQVQDGSDRPHERQSVNRQSARRSAWLI